MMDTFYRFSFDDFWLPYHLLPTVWVLSPFTTLQQICRSPSLTPSARTLIVGTSSSWIQPPPPRVAPFLLPFGATYTKRQQFSTRRLRKAEAHPTASGATAPPPGSLWEAPQPGREALQFPAVLAMLCQAGRLPAERKGKARLF